MKAVHVAAAIALGAAVVAASRPRRRVPALVGTAEPYAPHDPATLCLPNAQPGVVMFRDFVLGRFGGGDLGIVRDCALVGESGELSDHHEGRAWDWEVSASDPADQRRVDALLDFLGANDDEIWRRAGLRYVIWDGAIEIPGQTPRTAPYLGSDPHRGHAHFSFGKAGAAAQTSFYDWLAAGQPMR